MVPNEKNGPIRRFIIDHALRRARPGSGSSRAFLMDRTWNGPHTATLDRSRLSTPYVVVGAVATALYMPERATPGLDLLTTASDAPALRSELEALGCTYAGSLSIGGSTWRTPSGGTLDVIESDEPWVAEALAAPNRAPDGSPVVSLPYLVLMKLDASRAQDVADATRMLGLADEGARNEVRRVLAQYRPEYLQDVESMIVIGELELQ